MAEFSTLARPYAKAAFDIAQTQSLDDWSTTLSNLAQVVNHDDVSIALNQPDLSSADRAGILIEILGDQLNNEMKNFISLLSENNKLIVADEVSSQYEALKHEAEGTLQAEIITAMPIDDARQKKFAEALSKRFNKTVTLDITLDEALIGGAIVRAGDLVIDGSVTGRLALLENTLN